MKDQISIENLKESVSTQRKIINEIGSLFSYLDNSENNQERRLVALQIENLRKALQDSGGKTIEILDGLSLIKQLKPETSPNTEYISDKSLEKKVPEQQSGEEDMKTGKRRRILRAVNLEKLSIERMKKKEEKIEVKKEKKPSKYVQISSSFFYNFSNKLLSKGFFGQMKRDLVRANLEFVPANYISVVFFSTLLSLLVSVFIVLFFLFFSLSATPPFISMVTSGILDRFAKLFWIFIAIPVSAFAFGYFYPSLEKRATESRINQELPFAVIHMSSISSSMIEPSKIFSVIISTREYPSLEKEFIKLQNEINIYGYDLVTALKNRAINSPSKKLGELFNGLATTINSGGDLPGFFDKRAQSLLFEHKLDREKQAKAAETFMDIYISAVIAAPMILMLLLIMMRISGLGISLSTNMISLIMVLGVSLINILFLGFLQLKQPQIE